MALPGNYSTVTVTGTYVDLTGAPVSGTVTFAISADALKDAGALVTIMPKPISVTLNGSGSFSVALPATDDPDITPTGFTYTVTESFTGTTGRTYNIAVPTGGSLDLSVVAPASPSSGTGVVMLDTSVFLRKPGLLLPPSTWWWSPYGQANGNLVPVAGEMYLAPFALSSAQAINGLGIQTGAGGSGDANLYLVVYGDNNGNPGALLATSGALSWTTSGLKSTAISSVTLPAGRIFAGYLATGTTMGQVQYAFSGGKQTGVPVVYGTGSTPNVAQGNDNSIWKQTGLSSPPANASASIVGHSNLPNNAGALFIRNA